jgi:hypothetical protein
LSAYREKWNRHVDALAEHLERQKMLREGTHKFFVDIANKGGLIIMFRQIRRCCF